MASIVINNLPYDVGPIKGVDCAKYVGLKPCVNLKLVCDRPANKLCNRWYSITRAASDEPMEKIESNDEECEDDVVMPDASSLPFRYPVPISVLPIPISRRPRRNRKSPVLRAAFQETSLTPANFVYPLFIHEGKKDTPIEAMPGCYRLGWRHGLIKEVSKARDVGVNSFMLFPKILDALKSPTGDEALNVNGLVPRAIRLLKDKYPDLVIYTDLSLDPYTSGGPDGISREDGIVLDDEKLHQLCRQALVQARAGADVVCPNDTVDCRGRLIRRVLDDFNCSHVSIMWYKARYASSFYGPFHEALESNPWVGDKKTYQMNPAISTEALLDTRLDALIGADILLVKPGLLYLDIIRFLRDNSPLPIAAYQVSGEYSIIKAGGILEMINEKRVMMESLMCLRRAGADVIITHFALEAARCLCSKKK